MLHRWKVCTVLFVFLSFFFLPISVVRVEAAEEAYDSQNTMLALNMAIVSIHRIVTTEDRIILDQEYRNIINNLSIGNIEADVELRSLYDELLYVISHRALQQDQIKRFQQKYDSREKNLLGKSLSGIRPIGGDPWSFLGSLLTSGVSAYFGYQESKSELQEGLDDQLWQLQERDVVVINDLQRKLLSSSWTLLRKYRLPDDYRLTQKNLDDFYKAEQETDRESATRMFRMLEPDFKVYPPFWFFYGKAAMESGDTKLAQECFTEFEKIWRPVLRQDPYRVEVAKFRVMELSDKRASNDEIRAQLDIIRENTPREDWNNNLFAGVMYFAIDDQKQGIALLHVNVDFDVERDVSSLVLRSMEQGRLNMPQLSQELQTALEALNEQDKLSENKKPTQLLVNVDTEESRGLVAYFENRDQEAVDIFTKLSKTSDNPIPFHMLLILWDEGAIKSSYSYRIKVGNKLYQLFEERGNSSISSYNKIFPVVESYIDHNNIRAATFAGDMYYYGYGVEEDEEKAAELYRKAAEQGYARAQDKLGFQYQYGFGVGKDHKKAADWYLKATEQGYAPAQNSLGRLYYRGEGVNQDYNQAAEWQRKAAEQGYAPAQNALGYLYYSGEGVNQDHRQAAEWYRKSAEQGYAWGQYNLGNVYYDGKGVTKDREEAYVYFYLAHLNGLEEAQKKLYDLEGKGIWNTITFSGLSKAQIARAQRKAEEIQRKQEN